jgi:uncharacterized membrane protein YeiH
VNAQFLLPVGFDLGAVFLYALTGAWLAIRRKYDLVGVFTLALVTGVGGGLLRDAVFIQQGHPAAMQDARYVWAVVAASALGALTFPLAKHFEQLVATVDALALGVYAVVGAQKALATGLSATDAILVGVINATGGGLIRDVLVRDQPLFFKPGQYYVLAALAGTSLFTMLLLSWQLPMKMAAWVSIGGTFLFRMLAIRFNWRTSAMPRWGDPSSPAGRD